MKRAVPWALAAMLVLGTGGAAMAKSLSLVLPVFGLESLPIYVAQHQDYFTKRQLEIDVVAARGGGDAMKAFISGDAEILATGFPEVAELKARGVDIQLLVAETLRSSFGVVARKDLTITTFAGLKGKDIGVSSPGSLTEYIARYLALKEGWDPKRDIGVVALGGGPEILGALAGKKVDAAVLFEPFVTIGLHEGIFTMVADMAKDLDAFPTVPLVVHRSFLAEHAAEAKAIHDAIADADRYIQGHRAGALAIAQKKFATAKPDILAAAYDRVYPLYSHDGTFEADNIKRTQEICKELGIIKEVYAFDDLVAPIDR